jgi:hypothetical protein
MRSGAQHSAQESVLTVNGELRTLRRMVRLAHEWTVATRRCTNSPEATAGRVINFADELRYLSAARRALKDVAILAAGTGCGRTRTPSA